MASFFCNEGKCCKPSKEYVRKKCAKCNVYATEDKNLIFHRFPLPGKYGMSRAWAWAKYCFPDEDWSTEKSLQELHFQHKLICSKHFDKSCYTTGSKKRLNIFAIPSDLPDSTKHDTDSVRKYQSEMKKDTDAIEQSSTDAEKSDSSQPDCPTPTQAEMDFGETSSPSTSMSSTRSGTFEPNKRLTAEQASILCEFFEENPEIVRGYKRSPKCFEEVQNKWKKVTPLLNAVGPPRDHRSWGRYLCDKKAKLKKISIKLKHSEDGKDPIMCNTEDLNEIKLRMLQVLHKDVSNTNTQDTLSHSQDSNTSEQETENDTSYNDNLNDEAQTYDMEILPQEVLDIKPKLELLERNEEEVISHDTPPPDLQPHQLPFEDEFHYFGKNVAEQLRTLPLTVALETQEMLLSVLKKQRLKVLSSSDPVNNQAT